MSIPLFSPSSLCPIVVLWTWNWIRILLTNRLTNIEAATSPATATASETRTVDEWRLSSAVREEGKNLLTELHVSICSCSTSRASIKHWFSLRFKSQKSIRHGCGPQQSCSQQRHGKSQWSREHWSMRD